VSVEVQTKSFTEVEFDWIHRLKRAYESGYYKTEAAVGDQTAFPWQNKTCKNCPFWANSICGVQAEYRAANAHTCIYFNESNREAAQDIIRERQWEGYRRWWDWFNSR
jgi:hypothetical protein